MVAFSKSLAFLVAAATVVSGKLCLKPAERKEWRKLSRADQKSWLDATKCFGKLPHDPKLVATVIPDDIPAVNASGSYFDDFSYIHMDLNRRIHNTGLFFPWHRWYVNMYDTILRTKCNYKGPTPYWNWSLDAPNFYNSAIFSNDPQVGLGQWGEPTNDIQISGGALSNFELSYPSYHTIRRNYTLYPWVGQSTNPFAPPPTTMANETFTLQEVAKGVNGYRGDYRGYQQYVEGGSHSGIHQVMGGDLGGKCPINAYAGCKPGATWSPNDPLFFLLHANVDKLWYDWQQASLLNRWAFAGGSVRNASLATGQAPNLTPNSIMPTDGLFPEQKVGDVIDTRGGYLCYVYV